MRGAGSGTVAMLASEKLRDVIEEGGLVVDIDIVFACEIRPSDSCSQWVRLRRRRADRRGPEPCSRIRAQLLPQTECLVPIAPFRGERAFAHSTSAKCLLPHRETNRRGSVVVPAVNTGTGFTVAGALGFRPVPTAEQSAPRPARWLEAVLQDCLPDRLIWRGIQAKFDNDQSSR